jgi:hypothetical protein
MSKNDTRTLAEIAGTNRGLSKLTLADIKALAKGEAPAKPTKPKSEFYEKVIVGGREARALHQKANTAAASWMREKGLVPSGQAWKAVKEGERDVKTLRRLNEKDGFTPKKKGTGKGAQAKVRTPKKESAVGVTEQHESVTERDIEAEVATLVKAGFSDEDARQILGR